jgi:transcriptional regulator NrdR family protein
VGTDLIGRYYAEAHDMCIMTTRMFTHTGPRRGDVFHESTFAKQIAMIEYGLQEPKIFVGNLESLRTYADVRDAVKAYYMLVTINPKGGEYYNIGGLYTCKVKDTLDYLISKSTVNNIEIITDKDRLRPIDADLQVPDIKKFQSHTGWVPEITFNKTMDDLLEFWRDKIKSGIMRACEKRPVSIEKIDDGILCHFIELSIKKTNDYELFTSYIKYLASHNKFYKAFSVFTYFYFMKDNNQRTIYEKRQIVNTFIDLVKSFKKFNE